MGVGDFSARIAEFSSKASLLRTLRINAPLTLSPTLYSLDILYTIALRSLCTRPYTASQYHSSSDGKIIITLSFHSPTMARHVVRKVSGFTGSRLFTLFF